MKNKIKSLGNIRELMSPEIERLKNKDHITYIGIFGSYARNEQKETSDVDILVSFDPEFYPGYFDFLALETNSGVLKQDCA